MRPDHHRDIELDRPGLGIREKMQRPDQRGGLELSHQLILIVSQVLLPLRIEEVLCGWFILWKLSAPSSHQIINGSNLCSLPGILGSMLLFTFSKLAAKF